MPKNELIDDGSLEQLDDAIEGREQRILLKIILVLTGLNICLHPFSPIAAKISLGYNLLLGIVLHVIVLPICSFLLAFFFSAFSQEYNSKEKPYESGLLFILMGSIGLLFLAVLGAFSL